MNCYHYQISTSQGNISVWDSNPKEKEFAAVMIHANSASKEFFSNQMNSELASKYRFIAIDLPGHGESEHAISPEDTYSFPGYAKVVSEVVNNLDLQNFAVVGWSLGGHIALEMIDRVKGISGVLITGTPPIQLSPEGISKGFRQMPEEVLKLIGKEELTEEESRLFMAGAGYDGSEEKEWMVQCGMKTHGLARKLMFSSIGQGVGKDETEIVAQTKLPIAVIGGENDPGINYDYIKGLKFGNLWREQVFLIKGCGHAVVQEAPSEFSRLLAEFLKDIAPN